jgi:hypothetical protein
VRARFEGVSGQVPFADDSFRCRGDVSAGSGSREAADELALEVGDLAVGVLKATSVIIEVPPAI